MKRLSRKQAIDLLSEMWESGVLPSNFTEDHSDYPEALNFTMKHGKFNLNEFYSEQ
jgi:hypothetical protein